MTSIDGFASTDEALDHALIALSLPSWITFLVPLGLHWLPANVQRPNMEESISHAGLPRVWRYK